MSSRAHRFSVAKPGQKADQKSGHNAGAKRSAKPAAKPYKLFDGGGLFLLIHPNGSRYWRLKFRIGNKEKLFAVGVYPDVTLAEARVKALEARLADIISTISLIGCTLVVFTFP